MECGNSMFIANGLKVSVDWMAFTCFDYGDDSSNIAEFMDDLGFDIEEFTLLPCGGNGYKTIYKHSSGIKIYCDGQPGMGIHVEIPGTAVSVFLEAYALLKQEPTPFGTAGASVDDFDDTVLKLFLRDAQDLFSFTRIDLAIDDFGTNFYSVPEVYAIRESGAYVSKTRKSRYEDSRDGRSLSGDTICFGSRTSDMFLRVYDKKLEQKLSPDDISWVRWELEVKGKKANLLARQLLEADTIGPVAVGILSGFVRFVDLTASRASRCPTAAKWQAFLDGVAPLKLSVFREPETVEKSMEWLKKQCSKKMGMAAEALGFDSIVDLVDMGKRKMKNEDKRQVEDYKKRDLRKAQHMQEMMEGFVE